MPNFTDAQTDLLHWLSQEPYSQYGECYGEDLDALLEAGLAQVHAPGEHQEGFIARDHDGRRGVMFCAVSLTEAGLNAVQSAKENG